MAPEKTKAEQEASNPLSDMLRHGVDRKDRSPLAMGVSIFFHLAVAGAIVFASYAVVNPPAAKSSRVFFAAAPPPPPPPPPPPGGKRRRPKPKPSVKPTPKLRPSQPPTLRAPVEIPKELPTPEEEEYIEGGMEGGVEGGVVGGVIGGVVGGVLGGVLGGTGDAAPIVDLPFSQAKVLKQVRPKYPAIAKKAGVQGVVIVEAIIDTDGTVQEVKILRSIPLLDQAAQNAVKQWRFEPAVQGGQAVRMRLTVTVQFVIER